MGNVVYQRFGVPYRYATYAQYGPKWKNIRPPGLPAWARPASLAGEGVSAIVKVCRDWDIKDIAFISHVLALAYNESGLRLALPANTFNAAVAVDAGGRITAWGLYQWNAPALRRIAGMPDFPWGDGSPSTLEQEVTLPTRYYFSLYRQAIDNGMSPELAGLYIRLWHKGPAYSREYARAFRRGGPPREIRVNLSSSAGRYTRTIDCAELMSRHNRQRRLLQERGFYAG